MTRRVFSFRDDVEEHALQVAHAPAGDWATWVRNLLKRERLKQTSPRRKHVQEPEGLAVHLNPCSQCKCQPWRVTREIVGSHVPGDNGIAFVVYCGCKGFEYPQAETTHELVQLWNNGRLDRSTKAEKAKRTKEKK